ncbi:MAG TPA: hypothetical protein VGJ81_00400 [Thermoanaerobaculia bacterium]|jgi:hypothetical protein
MSKRTALVALVLFAALPLHAAFRDVVRAVEARTQMHPTYIPLLGLARFAVWIVHPEGVYDFQLATFEGEAARNVDFDELTATVRKAAGNDYHPLVQARSKRKGEFTYILAKAVDGNRVEFMLATHDHSDTVVIRAVIDADTMLAHINDPHSFARLGTK